MALPILSMHKLTRLFNFLSFLLSRTSLFNGIGFVHICSNIFILIESFLEDIKASLTGVLSRQLVKPKLSRDRCFFLFQPRDVRFAHFTGIGFVNVWVCSIGWFSQDENQMLFFNYVKFQLNR
jgi:hypothetical protein